MSGYYASMGSGSSVVAEGYAVFDRLLESEEVVMWLRAVQDEVAVDSRERQRGGVVVWKVETLLDALRPMAMDPRLIGAAEAVAGGPVEFLSVKPVFKRQGASSASPWHQDRPYWGAWPSGRYGYQLPMCSETTAVCA